MHPLQLILPTLLFAPLTFNVHAKAPKQQPGDAASKTTAVKEAPEPNKKPAVPLHMNAAPENAAHAQMPVPADATVARSQKVAAPKRGGGDVSRRSGARVKTGGLALCGSPRSA